ncbi:hypothetical protein HID58_060261 [Brassica napus]|uniref:Uncharacterized protein n=1 Tax=Brassica napus TaxID=3708 RepID=A0ABQ7ZV93_BRANA|nr:hypothetical protein HID58_060261 [Brassica napus]
MTNATKFLVMIMFIGVVCEAVSATKGVGVENGVGIASKDTKLGITIPKTAATNGNGFGTGSASTNARGSIGNSSP